MVTSAMACPAPPAVIPSHATGAPTAAIPAAHSMRPFCRWWMMRSPRRPASSPPATPPTANTTPVAIPERASVRPWMRLRNAGRKVPMAYMLKLSSAPERMIHHMVGILRMASIEPVSSGSRCSSAAPRAGSPRRSSTGTSSRAGAAASTIAARHPYACATGPLKK